MEKVVGPTGSGQWMPIDSAPKDGTPVLLWMPSHGEYSYAIEGWYFSSPKETDNGWETCVGFIGEPSHWMPLPEPPQ